MSFRTSVALPAPVNGTSQQAPHLRSPQHAGGVTNGWLDIAGGVAKRPGTDVDRKFSDQPKLAAKIKKLQYGDETYSVVYNLDSSVPVRVFRDGGNEASVSIDSDALTYMTSGSGVCRLFPLGDFAAIVNPDVATAVADGPSYSLERARPEYRDLIAYTTTSGNYLKTDEDSTAEKAGYFQYTPGSVTYALINLLTLTTPWTIHNGYWDDAGYFPCGINVAFRRVKLTGFTGATFTTATQTITKVGAFTSYTFRAGDMIYISGGTGFTAGWYRIASRTSNDAIVIVGGPGADNADTAANVTDATYSETNVCRIGINAEAIINATTMEPAPTSMHDIAAEFQKRIRETAGLEYATVAWVPQLGGGNFQITGFRGSGAIVYAPTAPDATKVGASGDLTAANRPFNSTSLQVFGGTGTASSPWDAPESRWTRTAATGQAGAILNPATMPVVLRRTAANTFTVSRPTWTPRGVGNSATNPAPKLVTSGSKIRCAARHRNRVFYMGGPYLMASELGDDYNFYNTATPDVLDTDPIDRTVSGENNADIRQVAGFREGLVLFTASGQAYEFSSGDTLTPKTAAITPTTRAAFTDAAPAVASPQLFFATPQGSYSGVREYVYDFSRASSQVNDVTVLVPRYLSGSVKELAISGEQRTLVALAGNRSDMWAYRWYYDGNDKIQSAWSQWTFDGNYSIASIDAVDGVLWMLVENTRLFTGLAVGTITLNIPSHGYSDGDPFYVSDSTTTPNVDGTKYVKRIDANNVQLYNDAGLVGATTLTAVPVGGASLRWHIGDYFIEKVTLGLPTTRSGETFPVHMDRKIRLTGTYAAGTTTFTLPSTPTVTSGSAQINGNGSTLNKVVTPAGAVHDIVGYTTTTVTVTGDLSSAGTCTLGRYFDWAVDLTRPYVRTDSNALVQDPLYVETATFAFADTLGLTAKSTDAGGDRTRAVSYSSPATGVMQTTLGGRADAIAYRVYDSGVGPATLTGIEYDIDHAPLGVVPTGRSQ